MLTALFLTLLVTISGAFVTYFYEDDAPFPARLAMGAVTGLAAWGLLGFLLASLLGLTPLAVILSTAIICAPLAMLKDQARRGVFVGAARESWAGLWRAVNKPTRRTSIYGAFYLFWAGLLWLVFDRAFVWDKNGGVATGIQNNLGDLPFHLSVITGFAHGQNFPPADPTFSGIKFTYPFITDFISAMYVAVGADLKSSLFVENYFLALSLVGLLHFWTRRLTKDRTAGLIAPLLVFFSGGLGWLNLLKQAKDSEHGLFGLLAELPQKFTIGTDPYRWGNAVTTLFVPQRGLLLGVPLALIVFGLVWKLTWPEEREKRRGGEEKKAPDDAAEAEESKGKTKKQQKQAAPPLPLSASPALPLADIALGAGFVAALIPLVHAHTYIVVMGISGLIALISLLTQARRKNSEELNPSAFSLYPFKTWAIFFAVAAVVAAPQMLWAVAGSAVQTSKFYGYKFGWDKPEDMSFAWFWFLNTGLFIPLTIAALVWRKGEGFLLPRRLLYFFAPFALCFIAPNLYQMSPWIWDNIKVLFYWWVGSAPIVALLLAHLWRQKEKAFKMAAAAFLFVLTAAGAADVWGILNGKTELGLFTRDSLTMVEIIKQKTPPRALIIHAPTFDTPVFLTGRQSVMGYPGHVWSHGIEPEQREAEMRSVYTGDPGAAEIIAKYGAQYIVVGPQEESLPGFNAALFSRYQMIGQAGAFKLYQVK
jgi:hypothetical protein